MQILHRNIIKKNVFTYQCDNHQFNTLQYIDYSKNWDLFEMILEMSTYLELKKYLCSINENRWFTHDTWWWASNKKEKAPKVQKI